MPVFASIHLGKCAGSAFANLLIREVSPRMPVLLFYGQGHPATGLWNNRAREPIEADGNSLKEICGPLLEGAGGTCLVHGHITAREYLEFLPQERELFAWLRHPLQRICSHYYYWKNNRLEPRPSRPRLSGQDHYQLADKRWHDWRGLRSEARPLFESVVSGDCSLVEFGCHPMVVEYYSATLAPLGFDGLAFAALTEHPERSLMRLSALLGIDLPSEMPVINTTRSKGAKAYELKREEESQILAANAADMELYHRALAQLAGDAKRSAI